MIEFALLLPFFAAIVLGTIDVARAFAFKNSLTNMARQGAEIARYAPYNLSTACNPSIATVARREDLNVTNATITVTDVATGSDIPASSTTCNAPYVASTRVRVTVSAPMTVLTPFVGTSSGGSITITNSVEVRTPMG